MIKTNAQQRANKKQNETRKGKPTFSSVRFNDAGELEKINNIILKFGKTKEAALIAAFNVLDEVISKN